MKGAAGPHISRLIPPTENQRKGLLDYSATCVYPLLCRKIVDVKPWKTRSSAIATDVSPTTKKTTKL